jgi:hypothetical protein
LPDIISGVNGVVRPFRSNTDLLAALKRRRAQSAVVTHAPPAKKDSDDEAATPAKTTATKSGNKAANRATSGNLSGGARKRFSPAHGNVASQPAAQSVEVTLPPARARQSPPTFAKRASQRSRVQEEPAAEEAEETQNEEVQQPARPSRSFTPRRRS